MNQDKELNRFARTIRTRICGFTARVLEACMKAFERAKEPIALFWIEGASHVDLYDKPAYVVPLWLSSSRSEVRTANCCQQIWHSLKMNQ